MIAPRRALSVALGGVLLMLTALAFDVSPLFVPGVAFTAIGLLTPLLVWLPARAATVTRELPAREVLEDEQFRSTVAIRAGRFGLPAAQLRDPLSSEGPVLWLPPSLHGRELRLEVLASYPRRGRKRLAVPVVQISDPLGLAPALRRGGEEREVLVLPRTSPVQWTDRGGGGRRFAPEHGTLADAFAASEVDGLRPYRPGTPASRIHWPAVARGAGLLERRMREEHESRPLVVLDARCPREHPERLDAAVRAAASLVRDLARAAGCGLLAGEGGRPLEVDHRLGGWPAAHVRLALAEPSERPPALAARRRPGRLFYVAAQASARPPQFLAESAGVLVLPAGLEPSGRWPVVLHVAGCTGYLLSARAAARPGEAAAVL